MQIERSPIMVAKVARLHFLPASPAGALRALAGWLIALVFGTVYNWIVARRALELIHK
jgi:ZIP family zinc transporter